MRCAVLMLVIGAVTLLDSCSAVRSPNFHEVVDKLTRNQHASASSKHQQQLSSLRSLPLRKDSLHDSLLKYNLTTLRSTAKQNKPFQSPSRKRYLPLLTRTHNRRNLHQSYEQKPLQRKRYSKRYIRPMDPRSKILPFREKEHQEKALGNRRGLINNFISELFNYFGSSKDNRNSFDNASPDSQISNEVDPSSHSETNDQLDSLSHSQTNDEYDSVPQSEVTGKDDIAPNFLPGSEYDDPLQVEDEYPASSELQSSGEYDASSDSELEDEDLPSHSLTDGEKNIPEYLETNIECDSPRSQKSGIDATSPSFQPNSDFDIAPQPEDEYPFSPDPPTSSEYDILSHSATESKPFPPPHSLKKTKNDVELYSENNVEFDLPHSQISDKDDIPSNFQSNSQHDVLLQTKDEYPTPPDLQMSGGYDASSPSQVESEHPSSSHSLTNNKEDLPLYLDVNIEYDSLNSHVSDKDDISLNLHPNSEDDVLVEVEHEYPSWSDSQMSSQYDTSSHSQIESEHLLPPYSLTNSAEDVQLESGENAKYDTLPAQVSGKNDTPLNLQLNNESEELPKAEDEYPVSSESQINSEYDSSPHSQITNEDLAPHSLTNSVGNVPLYVETDAEFDLPHSQISSIDGVSTLQPDGEFDVLLESEDKYTFPPDLPTSAKHNASSNPQMEREHLSPSHATTNGEDDVPQHLEINVEYDPPNLQISNEHDALLLHSQASDGLSHSQPDIEYLVPSHLKTNSKDDALPHLPKGKVNNGRAKPLINKVVYERRHYSQEILVQRLTQYE